MADDELAKHDEVVGADVLLHLLDARLELFNLFAHVLALFDPLLDAEELNHLLSRVGEGDIRLVLVRLELQLFQVLLGLAAQLDLLDGLDHLVGAPLELAT